MPQSPSDAAAGRGGAVSRGNGGGFGGGPGGSGGHGGGHGGGYGGQGGQGTYGGAGGGRRGAPRDTTPVRSSLPVSVHYRSATAESEVVLGDAWRIKPSDALLAALKAADARLGVDILY